MILQALTDYYQALAAHGEIAPYGWGQVGVSFALCIDENGALEQVLLVRTEQARGKKTVLAPQSMLLPAPVKRASNIEANFLCDNAGYVLGMDNKGKPEQTQKRFAACKALHEKLLDGVDAPAARALLAFFRTWQPAQAREHPALQEHLEEILSGANLVFRCQGTFVHRDAAVRQAWDAYYQAAGEGPEMVCLVTGETCPAESVHPSIKNVAGAQPSGAALVSFNGTAFCSYGKEQSLNAPTGKFAAFAYTTALNHLLADRDRVYRVGDATVVCWAQSGETAYQSLLVAFAASYSENDLRGMVEKLCAGQAVCYEDERLDPNMDFYILGLSPNAARLSVRFFLRNTFGGFLKNVQAHYARLEIVRPAFDKAETLSINSLLAETVNQHAQDKKPAPNMAGEVLRAVLTDTPYPATLRVGVALRIRAEQKVTRGRAAILKAYYLKHPNADVPKEVLTVSLNPESTNIPYNLGRLFSMLEAIQSAANPGINTTITDKYFSSACATPSYTFPTLIKLAQAHLKKMDNGLRVYYAKQLTALMDRLDEDFPDCLNLKQQGAFQIGYYQQTQARYEKKEEKSYV
ncbi:MAG: type I-C CRISPR-associated protein Cas8c/Csd1 [Agathobaculum sp.]|uniref:type I-C CRISPR-associated protein Cas8c/Csd1 n=1 Tax=Agathobaculum sp. TaxID=2048138 RepID=UPI002A7F71A7|nr:type I-C CRISPR-associated protein Cas8c/Csd1 [Agathobaculum sp.]MDY3711198.1 type I-C CRISPR-associated protein Cas8c/Csd1 [Agathobaculum sp.]